MTDRLSSVLHFRTCHRMDSLEFAGAVTKPGKLGRRLSLVWAVCVLVTGLVYCNRTTGAESARAEQIVRESGVRRGLVLIVDHEVHLAEGFAETGRFLVHLLVPPGHSPSDLRRSVHERGLGGRIVVGVLPPDGRLPHPDRFVNLAIANLDAKGLDALKRTEIQRVLALRGAGYLGHNETWSIEKPLPNNKLDGWYSHWYDASGNCVSNDRLAGIPQAVQWQHGPAFEDGTADGKVPRIADGYAVFLDRWTGDLVCRDAANGLLIWRRPVGVRHNSDLAISGGRVHLWFDADVVAQQRAENRDPDKSRESGFLTAFDLATGRVFQVYKHGVRAGTAEKVESLWRGRIREMAPVPWFVVTDTTIVQAYGPDLVVLDRETGERMWSTVLKEATWFSPIVAGDTVLAAEAAVPGTRSRNNNSSRVHAVTAYGLADGKVLWRNGHVHPERLVKDRSGKTYRARANFMNLSADGDLVLLHTSSYQFREGGSIVVLGLRNGKQLWKREFDPKQLYTQGSQRPVLRDGKVELLDGTGVYRFDARTGEPLGEPIRRPKELRRTGRQNGACTASRATVDWLMVNGWLYVGPDGRPQVNQAARGACGQGVVPAHGLVFVLPTACDCGDYVRGYMALSPRPAGRAPAAESRLVQEHPAPDTSGFQSDWPTFLGNPERTSFSRAKLDSPLRVLWKSRIAKTTADELNRDRRNSERYLGALSAPVVGGGAIVAAAPEQHALIALDAATGKTRWTFPTGGKVDSPPTLAQGLAVFGCDDGCVYALRLEDGKLAWRFRAAATDGVCLHHGHLASAYPVAGSVQILNDRVIAVAGFHTDLGGLHVWSLDLATGEPVAHRELNHTGVPALSNNLTVADADGNGFWVISPQGGSYGAGGEYHLSPDLKDLPVEDGDELPEMSFDRQGSRVRFRTNSDRGGSTHGWKGAMRANHFPRLRGHRVAVSGDVAFALADPTDGNHPVLAAAEGRGRTGKKLWQLAAKDLDDVESLGAMIVASDRVIVGGGKRDGSSGRVFVVRAATGQVLHSIQLPARVTECGFALANSRLYVCCEDGTIVCLGG